MLAPRTMNADWTRGRSLSTGKQCELRKAAVRECAERFRLHQPELLWLRDFLSGKGCDPERGLLVEYSECLEQGSVLAASGIWLTYDEKFFSFDVDLGVEKHDLLNVLTWKDATEETQCKSRKSGIQKTFGALAIEVLKELTYESQQETTGDR